MSYDLSHSPQPPSSDPTGNPRPGSGGVATRRVRGGKRVSPAESYSDRSSGEFSRQQQGESITTPDPLGSNSASRARINRTNATDTVTSPSSDLDVSRTMRPDEARNASRKLGLGEDDEQVLAVDTASPVSINRNRSRRSRQPAAGSNVSPQPPEEAIIASESNTRTPTKEVKVVSSESIVQQTPPAATNRRRRQPQSMTTSTAPATEEITHHVAPVSSSHALDEEVVQYQVEDPVVARKPRRTSSNSNLFVNRSRSGSNSSATPQHHDAATPVPETIDNAVIVAHTPPRVVQTTTSSAPSPTEHEGTTGGRSVAVELPAARSSTPPRQSAETTPEQHTATNASRTPDHMSKVANITPTHGVSTAAASPEAYGTMKRTLSTSPPQKVVPAPPPVTILQQHQLNAQSSASHHQLQRKSSTSPERDTSATGQQHTASSAISRVASTHNSPSTAHEQTNVKSEQSAKSKKKHARGANEDADDDDDIELSSCSSSGSSDEEDLGRRSQQRSGSTFGESASSLAASPNNRRRSTVTQSLLAHAHDEQKKLLAIDGTEIVAPISTHATRGTSSSVDRERLQAQVHSSASNGSNSAYNNMMMIPRSLSNASNSVTSYITQPIKRQSIADIRRALSFAPSPNSANNSEQQGGDNTPPQRSPSGSVSLPNGIPGMGGSEDPKLGNAKVRKFVTEIRDAMVTFRKDSGIGPSDSKKSMGDASFDEIRQAREILEHTKRTATGELMVSARSGPIAVESTDIKKTVIQLFDDLVKEGDRRGNMEVIRAMVNCIHSIDFASIIIVRQLHVAVCAEGFPLYLDVFLSMTKVREALTLSQITQMLQMATGHPVYRVGLLATIFRHAPNSPAGEKNLKDIRHLFHEAFEQAVSLTKAGPMEDRSQRSELITEAIKLDDAINFSTKDGGDKQTIFSRAAREGDVELVTVLLNNNLVEDVNRVQPDGTNALQQAAARGHERVVEVLVRLSNIAPSLAYQYPGRGTALDLAMNSKHKNGALIHMIKERAVELRVLSPEASPAASPTARSFSPAPMERRQSKASFARKKSIAMGAEQEEELEVINGVVDGTNVVKVLLTSLKPLYEQIQYEMSFEPQGEELRKVGILKHELHKAKEAFVMKLQKLEPEAQVDLRKDEVREDVLVLMDRLVEETSKMAGNLPLFELLVSRLNKTFDLLVIATEHKWFTIAAANGSVEYITALMDLEGSAAYNLEGFTTKDMFEAAAASTIYRIDSILHLFSFHEKLNLEYFQAILRPIWHQILEDVAAVSRARPQELRSNRMQLIKHLLSHPMVEANVEKQGDDRHSVFSRACAEGDAPLVYYLLAPQGGPDGAGYVKQPNVIAADSMTPLMHAAFNGHKNVVEVFIQLAPTRKEGIEMLKFKLQMQGGNAADVATRRKHKDVVEALKKVGVAPLALEMKP